MKRTIANIIFKYSKVIILMFLAFIGLKCIGYMMPTDIIREHIDASVNQIKEEGLGYKVFNNTDTVFFGQQLDNWTDSIYLNAAYSFGDHTLMERVAGDFRIVNSKATNEIENFTLGLTEGGEILHYARQWFGCISILRILLTIFTYPEIRIISQMLFAVLLFITSNLIRKKVDNITSIAFFLAIIFGNLPVLSASINIANSFYVVLISAIIVVFYYPKKYDTALCMFIVGALTCFFDLFVTPLLSYVFIMGLLLIMEFKNNANRDFLYYLKKTTLGSVGWIMGYFLLWIPKWIFASIVLKQNLFSDVINEMSKMSAVGTIPWAPITRTGLIRASVLLNMENMFPNNIIVILTSRLNVLFDIIILIMLFGFIMAIVIDIKNNGKKNIALILLLVSISPYVWYIIIHTHSFVHYWMTYRLQCGTTFLLLCIMGYGVNGMKTLFNNLVKNRKTILHQITNRSDNKI